jgi:7,8-dihydroneopterin aldolase/epimerase/oxygenase
MTIKPKLSSLAVDAARIRRVFVRDLEIVASVGIYEVEHHFEQRVVISVELKVDDHYDGSSEKLGDVLDYGALVDRIERLTQSGHFKLIETLAERIAELCLADARVISTTVRVEKPDIVPACRTVGIEIERFRSRP